MTIYRAYNNHFIKGITMQVMTAKEAKINFGKLIMSMQKEPVLITKNNKPVGAFISIDDLQDTHIIQQFLEQENNDDFVKARLQIALKEFDENGSNGKKATSEFYKSVLDKVKGKLN